MTYYAQKKNTNGVSLLAYFDTYSGKPMTNYPYTIRIDINNSSDDYQTCTISIVSKTSCQFADFFYICKYDRRDEIERRILKLARASLYELKRSQSDNLNKTYNPRRDYREKKPYSGTSEQLQSRFWGLDGFGEPIYITVDGKFE